MFYIRYTNPLRRVFLYYSKNLSYFLTKKRFMDILYIENFIYLCISTCHWSNHIVITLLHISTFIGRNRCFSLVFSLYYSFCTQRYLVPHEEKIRIFLIHQNHDQWRTKMSLRHWKICQNQGHYWFQKQMNIFLLVMEILYSNMKIDQG